MSANKARRARPLTTESGAPVADYQHSQTAGAGGPVLVQDQHLLEKLAHFNRERIPERVVHAKGSGAYGHFEVTRDVTRWTRARFLSRVGMRTEMFARFSTVAREPDKMLQGRLFAYGDAQRYRLGVNHTQLPVNRPHATETANYARDGAMRFDGNHGRAKTFEPNSSDGPPRPAGRSTHRSRCTVSRGATRRSDMPRTTTSCR